MTSPVSRWTDEHGDLSQDERRAQALLTAAREVGPLDEVALARVRRRLLSARSKHRAPRVAALAVALATFGSLAGASYWVMSGLSGEDEKTLADDPRGTAQAPDRNSTSAETGSALSAADRATEEPSSVESVARKEPPAAPARAKEQPVELAPAPDPAPPEDSKSRLWEESALLGQAVSTLRKRHDAARALSLLNEYDRRFPNGILRSEARLTRVQALVALNRKEQALTHLDAMVPRTDAPLLLRASLRSQAGRCEDALRDYQNLKRPDSEEALIGRARCLARLGQADAAEDAHRRYLQRYPDGAFADTVRQTLRANP